MERVTLLGDIQPLSAVNVTVPLPVPAGTIKAELDIANGILTGPVVVHVYRYALTALPSKRAKEP